MKVIILPVLRLASDASLAPVPAAAAFRADLVVIKIDDDIVTANRE
jgi:hypothetical protein